MADSKNIFQTIAEGVGNTNQNVVDLYNLVSELNTQLQATATQLQAVTAQLQAVTTQVAEVHAALFPTTTEDTAPNEDGSPK
jgi:prefoldin subunit 5